jgi:hypothetical protein
MINRLPGFPADSGSSARGLRGTAGNVLIDGKRPASKSDSLGDIVSRIPADQVERIEVIRGGAPGIDMQGQSVVANIIRKAGNTSQQTVTVGTNWFLQSGDNLPSFNYQTSRTMGPRSFDFSAGLGTSLDDSVGQGTRVRRDPSGAITRFETAGTEAEGRPLSAKGSFKTPLMGGELRANATVGKSNFKDEDHFRRPGVVTDVVGKSRQPQRRDGANYTRPLTRASRWSWSRCRSSASRSSLRFEQNAGPEHLHLDADSGESIARGVLRLKRSETLSFEAGAEAAFNFRDGQTG